MGKGQHKREQGPEGPKRAGTGTKWKQVRIDAYCLIAAGDQTRTSLHGRDFLELRTRKFQTPPTSMSDTARTVVAVAVGVGLMALPKHVSTK